MNVKKTTSGSRSFLKFFFLSSNKYDDGGGEGGEKKIAFHMETKKSSAVCPVQRERDK